MLNSDGRIRTTVRIDSVLALQNVPGRRSDGRVLTLAVVLASEPPTEIRLVERSAVRRPLHDVIDDEVVACP